MSLLVLEVLVKSMAFQARLGSETSAADFAIERGFGIMRLGDMTLELAINARTKGTFLQRAMNHLHMIDGVFIFDLRVTNSTRLQHWRLNLRVSTPFPYEP